MTAKGEIMTFSLNNAGRSLQGKHSSHLQKETFIGLFSSLSVLSFMQQGLWVLYYQPCSWTWHQSHSRVLFSTVSNLEWWDEVLDGRLHTPDFTATEALVVFRRSPLLQQRRPDFQPCFSLPAVSYFHMKKHKKELCLRKSHEASLKQSQKHLLEGLRFFSTRAKKVNTKKKCFPKHFCHCCSTFLPFGTWIHSTDRITGTFCKDIFWNLSLLMTTAAVCDLNLCSRAGHGKCTYSDLTDKTSMATSSDGTRIIGPLILPWEITLPIESFSSRPEIRFGSFRKLRSVQNFNRFTRLLCLLV